LAMRRATGVTGSPQPRERRRQQQDPAVASRSALAEERARQVRVRGFERFVDPVVDLAEEVRALAGTHAASISLDAMHTKGKHPGLTDVLLKVAASLRRGRNQRRVARKGGEMGLRIGDTAPDFGAQTTEGSISFHDWIGDSWAVLFSHPKDFTPVCTTELGYMASIKPEFDQRNVKIIGLSVDPVDKHEGWSDDIEETQGSRPNYPMIGDSDFNVSKLYGMLGGDVSGDPADRTAADNQTVRNVFVIGPDKKIKLILVYPMTTG